jgi:catechol 2,3-dioxygenase-like lactoylglutathione lyase family enzyme
MKYLHTMVRVTDLDASLRFYGDASACAKCAAMTTSWAAARWSSRRARR